MKFVFIEKCKPVHSILKSEKESASSKNWLFANWASVQTSMCSMTQHCHIRSWFPSINAPTTAHSLKAGGIKGTTNTQMVQWSLALQWWAATVSVSKAQSTGHSQKKRQNPESRKYIIRTVSEPCIISFLLPYPEWKIHTAQLKSKHSKNPQEKWQYLNNSYYSMKSYQTGTFKIKV